MKLFKLLPGRPIVNSNEIAKLLKTTAPTATKAISTLEKIGILKQIGEGKRNRMLSYADYLNILKTTGK